MLLAVGSWLMAFCRLSRSSLRRGFPVRAHQGFVLPLAITTSLVVLLGSASVHTLSLHARLRARSEWQQLERRDQRRSAAMLFAERAADPALLCLLAVPKADWAVFVDSCPGADPRSLQQGVAGSASWRLLDWQPTPEGGALTLALDAEGLAGELALRRLDAGWKVLPGLRLLPAHREAAIAQELRP